MNRNTQSGFALLYATVLVTAVSLAIVSSIAFLSLSERRIVRQNQESSQALFAAESGLEDAAYRIKNLLPYSSTYALQVGSAQAQVEVLVQGTMKTITSAGNKDSSTRKIQAVMDVSTSSTSFFYGSHVGDGGLIMDNNSQVVGNVFSNGDIGGDSGAIVTGTATVAGPGGKLSDISVEEDALANACEDAAVTQTLHANNNSGCSFGTFVSLGDPPDSIPLPISTEQIQQWRDEAEAGGVITGDYEMDGTDAISLGPKKIVGNLLVADKAVLTLTGNLWVTGSVDVKNDARVRLDAFYGAASGVIVADGLITLQNNSISLGSGDSSSYLMYLSTSTGNPAVNVKNNAIADILYASVGWILVENNDELREITGYGVHLKNNAAVTYEMGLADVSFSAGPGATITITSWKEKE